MAGSEAVRAGQDAMSGIASRLDHLGIAVPDLDAAVGFYRDMLGCPLARRVDMHDQGLAVAMLPVANTRIELLAPVGSHSPLGHLLEDRTINDFIRSNPAGGIHHICFIVPDLDTALSALVSRGGRVLGDGRGVTGVDGSRVVFLDPAATGDVLIELKQSD